MSVSAVVRLGDGPAADEPRGLVLHEGPHDLVDQLEAPGLRDGGEREARDADRDGEVGAAQPSSSRKMCCSSPPGPARPLAGSITLGSRGDTPAGGRPRAASRGR
jgi:hypothetical protein